jgi:hypothetical protein
MGALVPQGLSKFDGMGEPLFLNAVRDAIQESMR